MHNNLVEFKQISDIFFYYFVGTLIENDKTVEIRKVDVISIEIRNTEYVCPLDILVT